MYKINSNVHLTKEDHKLSSNCLVCPTIMMVFHYNCIESTIANTHKCSVAIFCITIHTQFTYASVKLQLPAGFPLDEWSE